MPSARSTTVPQSRAGQLLALGGGERIASVFPVTDGRHQAAVDVVFGEEPVGRQPGLAGALVQRRLPLPGVGAGKPERRQGTAGADVVSQASDGIVHRLRIVGVARADLLQNLRDPHAHAVVSEGVARRRARGLGADRRRGKRIIRRARPPCRRRPVTRTTPPGKRRRRRVRCSTGRTPAPPTACTFRSPYRW